MRPFGCDPSQILQMFESLPIAMNVTQKNILKDRWGKRFLVQQFNAEHQFAGKQCLERKIWKRKNTKFSVILEKKKDLS